MENTHKILSYWKEKPIIIEFSEKMESEIDEYMKGKKLGKVEISIIECHLHYMSNE